MKNYIQSSHEAIFNIVVKEDLSGILVKFQPTPDKSLDPIKAFSEYVQDSPEALLHPLVVSRTTLSQANKVHVIMMYSLKWFETSDALKKDKHLDENWASLLPSQEKIVHHSQYWILRFHKTGLLDDNGARKLLKYISQEMNKVNLFREKPAFTPRAGFHLDPAQDPATNSMSYMSPGAPVDIPKDKRFSF